MLLRSLLLSARTDTDLERESKSEESEYSAIVASRYYILLFVIDSRYEKYARRDIELKDTINRLYNDLESDVDIDVELETDERIERTIVGLAPS